MKNIIESPSLSEQLARLDKRVVAAVADGRSFSPIFLYQDGRTRKWAYEIHDRLVTLAGQERVRGTWWKIKDLSVPGVLAGAVSTALRADLIVVATDASEGMPLPFYVWIKAWLPHRSQAGGALAALLGKPEPRGPWSGRLTKFLRAAARQGRLEFLKEERTLPLEPGALASSPD